MSENPFECWVNIYPDDVAAFTSEEVARKVAENCVRNSIPVLRVAIRMTEEPSHTTEAIE